MHVAKLASHMCNLRLAAFCGSNNKKSGCKSCCHCLLVEQRGGQGVVQNVGGSQAWAWQAYEFIQTVNMRDKNLLFRPFHKPKTKSQQCKTKKSEK